MPARDGHVVVQLVSDVPAEDDVAEAQASFGDPPELVQRHVLAAQDAVDVEAAELHLAHAVLLERLAQALDLVGSRLLHGASLSRPEASGGHHSKPSTPAISWCPLREGQAVAWPPAGRGLAQPARNRYLPFLEGFDVRSSTGDRPDRHGGARDGPPARRLPGLVQPGPGGRAARAPGVSGRGARAAGP